MFIDSNQSVKFIQLTDLICNWKGFCCHSFKCASFIQNKVAYTYPFSIATLHTRRYGRNLVKPFWGERLSCWFGNSQFIKRRIPILYCLKICYAGAPFWIWRTAFPMNTCTRLFPFPFASKARLSPKNWRNLPLN